MTNLTYRDFCLHYLDYMIEYLSVNYPFSPRQIKENWDVLVKGDAFYPVYIRDAETICMPKFGLSFNRNVVWTDELRSQWKVGKWDPYHGILKGLGGVLTKELGEVEDANIDILQMIPLDIQKVISMDDALIWERAYNLYDTAEELSMVEGWPAYLMEMEEYPLMTVDELQAVYHKNKVEVLVNPSIWESTMKPLLTEALVDELLSLYKAGYVPGHIQDRCTVKRSWRSC